MKSTVLVKFAGLVAIIAVGMTLMSCTGESNNLRDPSNAVSASCTSIYSDACVTGRLVDDVAYNVDYECSLGTAGTVRSVTDTDGSFSCPAGGTVTFSIINPDHNTGTDKKIVLGSAKVVSPADIYNVNSPSSSTTTAPTVYTYLTPRNLTGDTVSPTSFGTATVNIVRLLQTLGRDANSEGTPAHRVVLDDNDKRLLTNLADSIKPSDFSLLPADDPSNPAVEDTFDYKVKDYLQSLSDPQKRVLVGSDSAKAALQRGIYSVAAGMYTVPGATLTTQLGEIATAGLSGSDPANGSLLGSLYMLVDRQGRMFGSGIYSLETTNTSVQTLWTNPKPLELVASGRTPDPAAYPAPLWPNTFSLSGVIFNLLDGSGTAYSPEKHLDLVQGSIERQAIAGTDTIYQNLFGEAVDTAKLGHWALYQGASNLISESQTNYTLEHTGAAAPTLDPDLWVGNADNIASKLPLALTAYFCNTDTSAPDAAICNSTGAIIATVRVVILSDGDIVSDIYQHCGKNANDSSELDPVTLLYHATVPAAPSPEREVPLGTVANAFSSTATSPPETFLSLMLMVPNSSYYSGLSTYLPYAQLAGNLGGASLLRVDGDAATDSDFLKLHGSTTDSSGTASYNADTSVWGNALTVYRAISAQEQENPSHIFPFTYSSQTQALQHNQGGLVVTRPTAAVDCH